MEKIITITITPSQEGEMIKSIMKNELGISSRLMTRMKQDRQAILLNGQHVRVTAKPQAGDVLQLTIEKEEQRSEKVVPVDGPVDIRYEDEDLLVVNKEAGVPVHPTRGSGEQTLANFLAGYYERRGETFTSRIINRLDKNTSGLVLLAKNALSGGLLVEQTKRREIKKTYYAAVKGTFAQTEGIIDGPIARRGDSILGRMVTPEGQPAVTQYWVLLQEAAKDRSLVRVRTLTGRTHQIRVHFSHIGHPLLGDFLYGQEEADLIPRHALHMGRLEFVHPLTKERMVFTTPVPEDMKGLFDALPDEVMALEQK